MTPTTTFFCFCLFPSGSDELKLEVARTCHVLAAGQQHPQSGGTPQLTDELMLAGDDKSSTAIGSGQEPVMMGYLWKKSQSASRTTAPASGGAGDTLGDLAGTANVWYRRWFALKRDNCLYYYKNQDVSLSAAAILRLFFMAGALFTKVAMAVQRFPLDGRRCAENNKRPSLILCPDQPIDNARTPPGRQFFLFSNRRALSPWAPCLCSTTP